MNQYNILLLPGDGIGPEITEVTKKILEQVCKKDNFNLSFSEEKIGGSAINSTGIPLPDKTLEAAKESDAILLAAIGSPEFDNLQRELRPESGLLGLRAGLDLFANIRPVKVFSSLIDSSSLKKEIIEDVDLVVVRELTSGIYFGQPKGCIKTESGERAFNTMSYSSKEIDRIGEVAFRLAGGRNKKICSIDKANVLEVSQLWRERMNLLSTKYSNIELTHQYVDNAAMQLVREPAQFDVIVTGNLFGDIISDEAAMLTGSIGMLPSASLSSTGPGLFEPVHGSAPDIAGQNKANPIAMLLSASMMLRIGLNQINAANSIEIAIENVLARGFRTPDLNPDSSNQLVGCQEMGELIYKELL